MKSIDGFVKKPKNIVVGYIVKYGLSDRPGYDEDFIYYKPGSFIIPKDVLCLFNHDYDKVLGRKGVNLMFLKKRHGIMYRVVLPDTSLGRDVQSLIHSGIINGISVGVWKLDERFERKEVDGVEVKCINTWNKVRLNEFSFVAKPAFKSLTPTLCDYQTATKILLGKEK